MRKTWYLGLTMFAILGIATGAAWFNRTNAQDAPKKGEPTEKDELFNQLKKALEEKKADPMVVTGPLTIPPPLETVSKEPLSGLPPKDSTSPFPPLPGPQTVEPSKPLTPPLPPMGVETPKPATPPRNPPPAWNPPPVITTAQPPMVTPAPAAPPVQPAKAQVLDFPPQTGPAVAPASPLPSVSVMPALAKDSPWTLHVEVVGGQTIVTATVNKKHEFKIVCQTLDLQTGKNTLKATGKVTIAGDMMSGSCDHLAIPLMEDRLVLEGSAQVAIQKMPMNVSTEKAASFELKGAILDLRISELQSAKLVQATWPTATAQPMQRDTSGIESRAVSRTSVGTNAAKPWTEYGVLRRTSEKVQGQIVWCLEGRDGQRFERFLAREGGSLDAYEGRNISVLLNTDKGMPRVTHIALP